MRCRNKTALHVSSCQGCVCTWDMREPVGLCAMYVCVCVCKVSLQSEWVCTRTFVSWYVDVCAWENLSICFCEFYRDV